jgi:hypothetical protein
MMVVKAESRGFAAIVPMAESSPPRAAETVFIFDAAPHKDKAPLGTILGDILLGERWRPSLYLKVGHQKNGSGISYLYFVKV